MTISNFPNTVDSFLLHSDIQASDIVDINTYKTLKLTANRTPAQDTQLNALSTQYRDKLFLADDLNFLQSAMLNIENFTKSTMTNYYKYMDAYVGTTVYTIFNSVLYTDGNVYLLYNVSGYVAGTIPTNTAYWVQISAKGATGNTGATGASGVGLVYKQSFNPNSTYSVNDCVTYSGNAYACILSAPAGKYPNGVDGATYWVMFISGGGAVGDVSTLNTVVKDTAVNAINEVNNKTGILTTFMNETSAYSIVKSGIDSSGYYTIVQHKRQDGTLIEQGTLSGGISPNYTTKTIISYASNGTTVTGTKVYTLVFDINGILLSETLS